ncbi:MULTISPECIES: DUF397 domain-containing protein [unclassified Streptomyces]|uniref:DUF397 domain-containing protein n=1 Tax=unclassified Streptomyces TaxID=2593676 RepID=UPI002E2B72DD|nr:DUF397 domain-containing protein [Streptomyces sp. NBC_01423]WSX91318.1 DUF397 domain-containing protein [Streptomyces sp. NBC_00891]WSY05796.1 DUF397 domain-containing protein [Streptomyces sp. NBC_00890]WSZ07420.1 DUF397 domain-containing protein [Streptomyces sp. NBC_00869]WSZ25081.1 DUF397 domain-containing protein [Streptomyces sp. NBC_00870]
MNCGTSAPGDFELVWIKSSYSSNGNEGDCVEVAAAPGAVLVRDSKDIRRPHLAHAPRAWAAFVAHAVRAA